MFNLDYTFIVCETTYGTGNGEVNGMISLSLAYFNTSASPKRL